MEEKQFILRKTSKNLISQDEIKRITDIPNIIILETSSRMVLVKGKRNLLEKYIEDVPEWILADIVDYSLSDSSHSINIK